jgi:hypothetical protein
MGKTEMTIAWHRDDGPGTRRLLEDLNGRAAPHGLIRHFRELFRVQDEQLNYSAWANTYLRLLRRYVDLWLETGCEGARNRPATRHPTREIDEIVKQVVTANRVVPVARKDGYAMSLVPPRTLANKRTAAARDAAFARQAAQTMFVALLMSPERLKIAKCAREGCGTYFLLGKWNHSYERGTRCSLCRQGEERGAKQDRVEANRDQAKRAVYEYAAQRFKRKIVLGKPWYLAEGLKAEVATAINERFDGDPLFRALYPQALTGKWLVAGREDQKNWQRIERAKLQAGGR